MHHRSKKPSQNQQAIRDLKKPVLVDFSNRNQVHKVMQEKQQYQHQKAGNQQQTSLNRSEQYNMQNYTPSRKESPLMGEPTPTPGGQFMSVVGQTFAKLGTFVQ